jgi:hypothetical protein
MRLNITFFYINRHVSSSPVFMAALYGLVMQDPHTDLQGILDHSKSLVAGVTAAVSSILALDTHTHVYVYDLDSSVPQVKIIFKYIKNYF